MTTTPHAHCCAPAAPATPGGATAPTAAGAPPADPTGPADARHRVEQCRVPAQEYDRGDAHGDGMPHDGERPVHRVTVEAFSIDATAVTVADFAAFVDDTGYRTDAERAGSSAVFHLVVAAADDDVEGRSDRTPWWCWVRGADWRHPEGPRSDVDGRGDHPVVHVSWHDARAYAAWAGRRLPTEAEWECASRGGVAGLRYPWGDDVRAADGSWRANIWQGRFPDVNTAEDGWVTTAPVRSYAPNGYGLWQTVGNVWEWCEDVFDRHAYERAAGRVGPPAAPDRGPRVLRGGSYLCHDSYCTRYRNAARSSNTPGSTMGNAGFRTVAR